VLSDVVWTAETLFEYMADPRKFIPGTRDVKKHAGVVKSEADRANVIAYLEKQKWNVWLLTHVNLLRSTSGQQEHIFMSKFNYSVALLLLDVAR